MTDDTQATAPLRVLIAGGGVAGLEVLLALRELAGDKVEVTLLAPKPEFVYRPMIVEEAFSLVPAERHELDLLVADRGGEFVLGELSEVVPDKHLVPPFRWRRAHIRRRGDVRRRSEPARLCSRRRPFAPGRNRLRSTRRWQPQQPIPAARSPSLSHRACHGRFPLYELAMFSQLRAAEQGLDLKTMIVTPEPEPLAIFGPPATDAVAGMLRGRGIEVRCGASVVDRDGDYIAVPDGEKLDVGAVVALPVLSGPNISGLPSDGDGFIPTDEHGQVRGVEDVFAAGDGTDFPIKQGGLGTQQADACAEMIAVACRRRRGAATFHAGASREAHHEIRIPQPFRRYFRGRRRQVPRHPEVLWWPSRKLAGRYLAPYLSGTESDFESEASDRAHEIEVSLPSKWHGQPVGWDSK